MSALKYQLREILPSLIAEAKKCKNPEIKKRLYLVKAVVESPKGVKTVCESRGTSRETFYKWGKKLVARPRLESLESESRKPKTSPNRSSKRVERAVKKMKKTFSFMGPERISFYLERNKGLICPPSTVYAILKRMDLINKKYRSRRTKKHMKRYRRPVVGYLQMDIKYVPYKVEGKQYYQWSVVDHHSSWRFIRCYSNKSLKQLEQFLDDLEGACPFVVIQIQTDNDKVFTDKFWTDNFEPSGCHDLDEWCAKLGIEHKLIPPGMKELNGKVENTHKYDDEEFYSQHDITSLRQLELLTEAYNKRWNEERHTKTLGWKTPLEVVFESMRVALLYAVYMLTKYPPTRKIEISTATGKIIYVEGEIDPKTLSREPDQGSKIVEVPKKKLKKKTYTEQYLMWVDWDDKSYKVFTPVSAMSQNFSPSGPPIFYFLKNSKAVESQFELVDF